MKNNNDPENYDKPEEPEIIEPTALAAITSAEIDIQIATAKRYPRQIKPFLDGAIGMATLDVETAGQCEYALPRRERKEDGTYEKKMIKGPSIRLAEILATNWGNSRIGGRIIEIGDKFVTAQGMAADLERNNVWTQEVKRRITSRSGARFSDDMIVVTCNAAVSIAVRDVIYRMIPKAFVNKVLAAAKKAAIGDLKTLSERRDSAIKKFKDRGISQDRLLAALEKSSIEDISLSDIETLLGFWTALEEGISADEIFPTTSTGTPEHPKTLSDLIQAREQQKKAKTALESSPEPPAIQTPVPEPSEPAKAEIDAKTTPSQGTPTPETTPEPPKPPFPAPPPPPEPPKTPKGAKEKEKDKLEPIPPPKKPEADRKVLIKQIFEVIVQSGIHAVEEINVWISKASNKKITAWDNISQIEDPVILQELLNQLKKGKP